MIEPDLALPRYALIHVVDEPDLIFDIDLAVYFDQSRRRYEVHSMTTTARRTWDSRVSTFALRDVAVDDLLRRGLGAQVHIGSMDGPVIPEVLDAAEAAAIRAAGIGDDETLRWVARIYARADALLQAPLAEVQRQLQMPRPTASVWLRRARDRGFLPEPDVQGDEAMHQVDSDLARRVFADG